MKFTSFYVPFIDAKKILILKRRILNGLIYMEAGGNYASSNYKK